MMEFEQIDDYTVELTTNMIVLDRINAADTRETPLWGLANDRDNFRGAPVEVDFTVEITRSVTTQTLVNQRYDHINRRVVNEYNFETIRAVVYVFTGRTLGGRAELINLPTSDDPLISYSIIVRYNDTRGLGVEMHIWSITHFWRQETESIFRHFNFYVEGREFTDVDGWWFEPRDLRVGETTNIVLREGHPWFRDNHTTPTTGRMMVILVRDGILSVNVGSPTGTPLTMPEEAISNAMLFGAYFDRGYIFMIEQPSAINYDYTEREIQIEMEFDAERYSPGDEVTVTVRTTDENGRALPSRVTVSVVDESAMLGRAHNANFLSRLHRSSQVHIWNIRVSQFASHRQHAFDASTGGGAEGGGAGDAGAEQTFRDWFLDNPVFEVIQTDDNGVGTLTFTLPDQITSWRVTAIGLTRNGFAGDERYNIISTLPFFVDLLVTNEFLVGDDIAASARVFADATVDRALLGNIDFSWEILHDGELITASQEYTGTRSMFNAGKLPAGEYLIRVSATAGGFSDAVELPFSVVESGMIIPTRIIQQVSPEEPELVDLIMRSLPVQITLTNGNIRQLANIMHGTLSWGSLRTDVMAATAFVNNFHGGEEHAEERIINVRSQIHASNGGIPQLTYADAELQYTARFAASLPEFVNRDHIIRYIESENDPHRRYVGAHQRAVGLLALAAIGEPVLLDIQWEIGQLDFLPVSTSISLDRYMTVLYLSAALVAAGDDAAAQRLMNQLSQQTLTVTSDAELANALRLFINTAINPQEAWEFLAIGRVNRYVSDVPERINFVRNAIFLEENISEVQFTLDGVTKTVVLENFARHSLHITAEQFENLNLTPISGTTDFDVQFFSYDARNWDANGNRLRIERSITREGGLYRVDIRVTIPRGQQGTFTIYDRMPSNMRFVPMRHRVDQMGWATIRNTQRQLVEINFHQSDWNGLTRTFSYFMAPLFEGDMVRGSTYVSGHDPRNHIWGAAR